MSLTARPEITDKSRRVSAIDRLRTANVRLPTFRELAKPETIAANTETSLKAVDPDAADARNLWRVHWFNDATRKSRIAVPGHIVLPELLTPSTIANFFKILQERKRIVGRGIIKTGIKKSTVATYWGKLNSFFKWLKIKGIINVNPFSEIKYSSPAAKCK